MAGPFKMKGSPMQRNFGVGSPLNKGTDYTAMQAKSAKADPRYGKMSAEDYKAEVGRQVKSKKETGSYDAMGTEAKARKAKANAKRTSTPSSDRKLSDAQKTENLTPQPDKVVKKKRTKVGKFFTKVKNKLVKGDSKKGVAIEAKDTEHKTLTKKQAARQDRKKAKKAARTEFRAKKKEIRESKEA
tara:strand:- start:55 stop:612 length:558 start_codon:yes stop_codon:yes gene_type:complete